MFILFCISAAGPSGRAVSVGTEDATLRLMNTRINSL